MWAKLTCGVCGLEYYDSGLPHDCPGPPKRPGAGGDVMPGHFRGSMAHLTRLAKRRPNSNKGHQAPKPRNVKGRR
jgi:hypothetical protein